MISPPERKVSILEAITAPLGFFVLALLIVESFLGLVLTRTNLEKSDIIPGIYVGVGLFCFVVILVFVLVWFKPENLTFDKEANLRRLEQHFGSSLNPAISPAELAPTNNPAGEE